MTKPGLAPLAWLWAGVSLGGNLIAAPAKFQVSELTTAQLLRVGRAQFDWLGSAEWALLAAAVAVLAWRRCRPSPLMVMLVVVFLCQQWWLHPLLQARTNVILSGGTPPPGLGHLVFVLTEISKFVLLCVIGWHAAEIPRRTLKS